MLHEVTTQCLIMKVSAGYLATNSINGLSYNKSYQQSVLQEELASKYLTARTVYKYYDKNYQRISYYKNYQQNIYYKNYRRSIMQQELSTIYLTIRAISKISYNNIYQQNILQNEL